MAEADKKSSTPKPPGTVHVLGHDGREAELAEERVTPQDGVVRNVSLQTSLGQRVTSQVSRRSEISPIGLRQQVRLPGLNKLIDFARQQLARLLPGRPREYDHAVIAAVAEELATPKLDPTEAGFRYRVHRTCELRGIEVPAKANGRTMRRIADPIYKRHAGLN
jgi:hypothetical protein